MPWLNVTTSGLASAAGVPTKLIGIRADPSNLGVAPTVVLYNGSTGNWVHTFTASTGVAIDWESARGFLLTQGAYFVLTNVTGVLVIYE